MELSRKTTEKISTKISSSFLKRLHSLCTLDSILMAPMGRPLLQKTWAGKKLARTSTCVLTCMWGMHAMCIRLSPGGKLYPLLQNTWARKKPTHGCLQNTLQAGRKSMHAMCMQASKPNSKNRVHQLAPLGEDCHPRGPIGELRACPLAATNEAQLASCKLAYNISNGGNHCPPLPRTNV